MGEALMVRRGGAGGAENPQAVSDVEFVRNGDKEVRVFIPYAELGLSEGLYVGIFMWRDANGVVYHLRAFYSTDSSGVIYNKGNDYGDFYGENPVVSSTKLIYPSYSTGRWESSPGIMRFTYTFSSTVAATSITVIEAKIYKLTS